MRIPFWRSGKGAPVEKAKSSASMIAAPAAKPVAAKAAPAPSDFGDLDLRAIGQALNRKRS